MRYIQVRMGKWQIIKVILKLKALQIAWVFDVILKNSAQFLITLEFLLKFNLRLKKG